MKCLNQCAVIVGSVVNIGMKIVKIVIWEGLGAGRRTTDGGMADDGRRTGGHHLGSGVFFFFLESWDTSSSEERERLSTSTIFIFCF